MTAVSDSRRRPPYRLAIFTSHPVQYHAPLFRRLADHPQLAPLVFFGCRHGLDAGYDPEFQRVIQWDTPLVQGYPHVFLENRSRRAFTGGFWTLQVPEIALHWTRDRFDACLVFGWGTLAHLQAIRAGARAGIPLFLRGDSHLGMHHGSPARRAARAVLWYPIRARLYRRMFDRAAGMLVVGARNAEYYRSFGVPEHKLIPAPHCVDNEHFVLPGERREAARAALRGRLGIGAHTVVFTSAAKLIAKKRPLDLFEAFRRVVATGADCHLLYVGDGPEREMLEQKIRSSGLEGRVTISGFVNQSAMPEWYAASDCLVLPSDGTETWGLVVNEAMAAGLPVLVSDAVGCAPDLVREEGNGFVFPLGNVQALADRMVTICTMSPAERARMAECSRGTIAAYSYDRVIDSVVQALEEVVPQHA